MLTVTWDRLFIMREDNREKIIICPSVRPQSCPPGTCMKNDDINQNYSYLSGLQELV